MIGSLFDIGYDQVTHDQLIERIVETDLSIIIKSVAQVYQTLYDQSTYTINCGNCESFAHDVISLFGKGEVFWHDEMLDCSEKEVAYWSHCFVWFDNRAYDSQCPEGVDQWRELSCFVNNPLAKEPELQIV